MTSGAEQFPYPTDDPQALRSHGRVLGNVASLFSDVGGDVDDANLLLASSWHGDASATAVADISAIARLLPADSRTVSTAVTAMVAYAGKLETARGTIGGLQRSYDDAQQHLLAENRKIPHQLPPEDRDPWRKANQTDFETTVGPLQKTYEATVHDVAADAKVASEAVQHAIDTLSPPQYRTGPSGQVSAGSAAFTALTVQLSLVTTVDGNPDPYIRGNQYDAFVKTYGRPPSGPGDWQMAAILDPTTYQAKNKGTPSVVQVGSVTPHPGMGLVRLSLYIPSPWVYNVADGDLGDNRGMDVQFDPEQARVALYIDYETGRIVVRQNPSVSTSGTVAVKSPDVRVQQMADGRIRVFYNASNALSPPGGDFTGHTVNGDIVVTPSGGTVKVNGTVGDYPSLEVYHDNPLGVPDVVAQDEADNQGPLGPALWLTQHHEIGTGAVAVDPFYDDPEHHHIGPRNPFLKYPDRYPDTRLGDPANPPGVVTVP